MGAENFSAESRRMFRGRSGIAEEFQRRFGGKARSQRDSTFATGCDQFATGASERSKLDE